jgi:hypothetical protein
LQPLARSKRSAKALHVKASSARQTHESGKGSVTDDRGEKPRLLARRQGVESAFGSQSCLNLPALVLVAANNPRQNIVTEVQLRCPSRSSALTAILLPQPTPMIATTGYGDQPEARQ